GRSLGPWQGRVHCVDEDVLRCRSQIRKHLIRLQAGFESEACLLENPGGCPVIGMAGSRQPSNPQGSRDLYDRDEGLRRVTLPPRIPREHVSGRRLLWHFEEESPAATERSISGPQNHVRRCVTTTA